MQEALKYQQACPHGKSSLRSISPEQCVSKCVLCPQQRAGQGPYRASLSRMEWRPKHGLTLNPKVQVSPGVADIG